MISGKERAKLKGFANGIKPLLQIGKGGISQGVIDQLNQLLEDHELVKITFLKNSIYSPKEVKDELLEATGAEFVQAIGSTLTLFRKNPEESSFEEITGSGD
ncbi:MAG: YhbY family RNA-binding protein [Tissierellia bacterium]|nr:YhbY family RNA-binding protein [Tissierellia bacterium]